MAPIEFHPSSPSRPVLTSQAPQIEPEIAIVVGSGTAVQVFATSRALLAEWTPGLLRFEVAGTLRLPHIDPQTFKPLFNWLHGDLDFTQFTQVSLDHLTHLTSLAHEIDCPELLYDLDLYIDSETGWWSFDTSEGQISRSVCFGRESKEFIGLFLLAARYGLQTSLRGLEPFWYHADRSTYDAWIPTIEVIDSTLAARIKTKRSQLEMQRALKRAEEAEKWARAAARAERQARKEADETRKRLREMNEYLNSIGNETLVDKREIRKRLKGEL